MRRYRLLLVLPFAAAGCVGDLVELGGGPKDGSAGADMATGGGGQDLAGMTGGDGGMMPQDVHFSPDIETDIENLGCTAAACHGNDTQAPSLKNGAVMQNFMNFKTDAMTGENSPVLTKNLQGSGVTHGGGSKFQSTSDPVYVRWLAWINAGNPL